MDQSRSEKHTVWFSTTSYARHLSKNGLFLKFLGEDWRDQGKRKEKGPSLSSADINIYPSQEDCRNAEDKVRVHLMS